MEQVFLPWAAQVFLPAAQVFLPVDAKQNHREVVL
jgi:hypothetical protein